MEKIVSTGIDELDCLLGGGFKRGDIILIIGPPGSGKTILSATIVHNIAVKYGVPCLYVSFTELKHEFYENMARLGLDFEELERRGLIKYVSMPTMGVKELIEDLVDYIITSAEDIDAKVVVLDPLTPITLMGDPLRARVLFHNTFMRLSKLGGRLLILTGDIPLEEKTRLYSVDFIADYIIRLEYSLTRSGVLRRVMKILKSRGKEVLYNKLDFEIFEEHGIHIATWHRPLSAPSLTTGEHVPTGIDGLDKVLAGGLKRGSSTLIYGPPGSGKSWILLSIACKCTLNGEKVSYISMMRREEAILSQLRWIMEDLDKVLEKLRVVYVDHHDLTPARLHRILSGIYREFTPSIIVWEGIQNYVLNIDFNDFYWQLKEYLNINRSVKSVMVSSLTEGLLSERAFRAFLELFDNVFKLSLEKRRDEVFRCILAEKIVGAFLPSKRSAIVTLSREGLRVDW